MKNKQIEYIRAILILMIIFYHYTYRFEEIFDISTINFYTLSLWGEIGVACFFIISGYFIFPKRNQELHPIIHLGKRISRLYPSYLLCVTLCFLSIQCFGLENRPVDWWTYVCNLFMINGFIGVNYIDGAHWYLTYLILFNVIVALLTLIGNKIKLKDAKFKLKRTVLLMFWLLLNVLVLGLSNKIPILVHFYKLLGNKYVYYLYVGICLKGLLTKEEQKHKLEYHVLLLISLVMILLTNNLIMLISVIIFSSMLTKFIQGKFQLPESKVLWELGKLSYVLYLIHQNIGYQIILYLTNHFGEHSLLYAIITLGIMILASWIIHSVFDAPIQSVFDKYWSKKECQTKNDNPLEMI
ncbi:MAG: acyltransferase [bacterium]|nr:acyltransferase [bacterium]